MIRVHIDRVVLDGMEVSVQERPGLRASIERELGVLMAKGKVGPALGGGGAVPVVRGPALSREGRLGARIARSVYGAISQ